MVAPGATRFMFLPGSSHQKSPPAPPRARGEVESPPMYLIAIAWLYVVLLVAVADTTVVGGVLTFALWGLAPLALFLWLFGTPARHRSAARRARASDTDTKDRGDSGPDQ